MGWWKVWNYLAPLCCSKCLCCCKETKNLVGALIWSFHHGVVRAAGHSVPHHHGVDRLHASSAAQLSMDGLLIVLCPCNLQHLSGCMGVSGITSHIRHRCQQVPSCNYNTVCLTSCTMYSFSDVSKLTQIKTRSACKHACQETAKQLIFGQRGLQQANLWRW